MNKAAMPIMIISSHLNITADLKNRLFYVRRYLRVKNKPTLHAEQLFLITWRLVAVSPR